MNTPVNPAELKVGDQVWRLVQGEPQLLTVKAIGDLFSYFTTGGGSTIRIDPASETLYWLAPE